MLYTLHMGKYCGVLSRESSVRTSSGHTLHSLGTLRILWYVCLIKLHPHLDSASY